MLPTSPSRTRRLLALIAALAVLGTASTAAAQQPAADGPQAAPAAEAADGPQAAPAEEAEEALDPDDPDYWAKVRDIYTFQKRPFEKQGRFAATIYGGLIPNNIFEQYYPVGLRLNYFILENIGIELAGAYAFKSDTGLKATVSEQGGIGAQDVLIGDTQVAHSNFGIVWSPFYGKTAFYNTALNYFDLYLVAGAGMVVAQTTPTFNAEPETEVKPEGVLGAGMAFYFGDHAALRLDYRQFVFQKVTSGVARPSEVSLGFGWFL